jgi:hypothetical protein
VPAFSFFSLEIEGEKGTFDAYQTGLKGAKSNP